MPSVDSSSVLRASFKEYFETGLYSDLTIEDSNGHEYAVHRSIVYGQSPVLANSCKPEHGSQEAQTGDVIDLEHDDPDAVKAMLEFMYTASYKLADDGDAMAQTARIFMLSDKYSVSELKEVAATQLTELLSTCWETANFVNLIRFIYESLPSNGGACALREMVVGVVAEHYIVLLDKPEFQTILEDFSALGMDILRVMAARNFERRKKYTCPNDSYRRSDPHTVTPSLGMQHEEFYCNTCKYAYDTEKFKLVEDI